MNARNLLPVLGLLLGLGALAQTAPPAPAPAAPAAPAAPTKFKISDANSTLYVQVFKDPETLAASLSHDHVIKATGWTGSVNYDAANPAACAVDISLPVKGLRADPPELRKAVGYDTVLDEDQRKEVEDHMLGADQLNAASFPNITFKGSKCEVSGNTLKITGGLTIRGKTKTMTLPLSFSASGNSFTAKGSFTANHSDFGFEPFTALLGQLKNKGELKFTLDVKGAAQ